MYQYRDGKNKITLEINLPNHTHSRAHQALRPVAFLGNDVEQLEDGLNERLDQSDWMFVSRVEPGKG
jgi:hypothetical protein